MAQGLAQFKFETTFEQHQDDGQRSEKIGCTGQRGGVGEVQSGPMTTPRAISISTSGIRVSRDRRFARKARTSRPPMSPKMSAVDMRNRWGGIRSDPEQRVYNRDASYEP